MAAYNRPECTRGVAIVGSYSSYLTDPIFWLVIALGAIVGSFLNVCIVRIPDGTFFRYARSVCPHCLSPIPMCFNIPVFGFVVLRGRARCCGKLISPMYPVVELVTAVIFAGLYIRTPFARWDAGVVNWYLPQLLRFSHNAVISSGLIICSVTDLRQMIIPDKVSLPLIVMGPVFALWHPEFLLLDSLLGILVGAGLLYVIAWGYFLIRRQIGIGFGDVKLLAAIGGWLGYQGIFPTILVGSISGSIIGIGYLLVRRSVNLKTALPFGPFLAFGAIMHIIFGGILHQTFGY